MVQKITPELLRKRAEHNEGDLASLQEVALHQFDIERIENLDVYCRDLKILLLQNNQIRKIENLGKLKGLRYLNLALNNVEQIEGLEHCEDLEKLDLTVNFVRDLRSVAALRANRHLRELYLVGNPCTDDPGYRAYVAATLPQLEMLDGRPIERSDRLRAEQEISEIRARLDTAVGNEAAPAELVANQAALVGDEKSLDERRARFQTQTTAHTPAARLAAAREIDAFHEPAPGPKPNPLIEATKRVRAKDRPADPDGRIFQCNEGKWPFTMDATPALLVLRVQLSKFLDSSLVNVRVQRTHVTVEAKGKTLQLLWEAPVDCDAVLIERSQTTGELAVTALQESASRPQLVQELGAAAMPKTSTLVLPDLDGAELVEAVRKRERRAAAAAPAESETSKSKAARRRDRLLRVDSALTLDPDANAPIKPVRSLAPHPSAVPFVDNPDVPPLC